MSTLNYDRSSKGAISVKGQTMKTPDSDEMGMGLEREHDTMTHSWHDPAMDQTVREIEREVEEMRLAGKLRPFTEGEPIGILPKVRASKPLTRLALVREHRKRMEGRREEMLTLRAKNDAVIASILRVRT